MISLGAERSPVSQLHERLNLPSALETCHWGSKTAPPGDYGHVMYTFLMRQRCARHRLTPGRLGLQRGGPIHKRTADRGSGT